MINYKFQDERTGTLDALKIGMNGIESDFILIPGDNYVSEDSFLKFRDCNGPVLLSGKANRWSKWGDIEFEKSNTPSLLIRPKLGLYPMTPQYPAGLITEPEV